MFSAATSCSLDHWASNYFVKDQGWFDIQCFVTYSSNIRDVGGLWIDLKTLFRRRDLIIFIKYLFVSKKKLDNFVNIMYI